MQLGDMPQVAGGKFDELLHGVIFAITNVSLTSCDKNIWILRVEPDCFIEISSRAVVITFLLACSAADVERIGIIWIEPDTLSAVGYGAVVLPIRFVRIGTVAEGDGIFRIEPDGFVEIGNCAVEIVARSVGSAPPV